MIRSMTGFARREKQSDWGTLSWELRSVNHRYLEISWRLPEEIRPLETELRKIVSRYLKRGKIECGLQFCVGPIPRFNVVPVSQAVDETFIKHVALLLFREETAP